MVKITLICYFQASFAFLYQVFLFFTFLLPFISFPNIFRNPHNCLSYIYLFAHINSLIYLSIFARPPTQPDSCIRLSHRCPFYNITHEFIHLFIFSFIYLSVSFIYLTTHLNFFCLCIYLCTTSSIHPFTCPPTHSSIQPTIHSFIISPSIHPFMIYPSTHPSIHLLIDPFIIYPFIQSSTLIYPPV